MATTSPVYLFKHVKHGILRIFKLIATSGFQTALECPKFVFGRLRSGPTGRAPQVS